MRRYGGALIYFLGTFFGLYIFVLVAASFVFDGRFGYGAQIAGQNVSFQSEDKVRKTLENAWAREQEKELIIDETGYQKGKLVRALDIEKSIDQALNLQQRNYLTLSFMRTANYSLSIEINSDQLTAILSELHRKHSRAVASGQIVNISGKLTVIEGKKGKRLLIPETKEKIVEALSRLDDNAEIKTAIFEPSISTAEATSLLDRADEIVAEPITIETTRGDYRVTSSELKNWLGIRPKNPLSVLWRETILPVKANGEYYFFDESRVSDYSLWLASQADQKVTNAKLSFADNKLTVIKRETTGYTLDQKDLTAKIQDFRGGAKRTIPAIIEVTEAEVRSDNLTELGIVEKVSTGWSSFTGSPKNRIHNVRTGASKFDQVIVRPGEKFSFNTILGPVDASTGYLPELVILVNKTVPQYGGGLCQVSSTAFRAALNAGFPIIERRNHAYPVSYYRPYGVDATIYLPKPDLVFLNDSGHYLLIQTRIEGTKLYFDFFGTRAERTIKFAGNKSASGAVDEVEKVTPAIYDQGKRGEGSFTAAIYRFKYDLTGKLIKMDTFVSKYDSPDKYPH